MSNEEKGSPICDRKTVMEEITQNFLLEKPKKRVWGNFRIEDNKIIYRPSAPMEWNGKINEYQKAENPPFDLIATKTKGGTVLGNASILPLVGRTVAYGNEHLNRSQTKIQSVMEDSGSFDLIPFNVFDEADLDIDTYKMINEGGSETIKRERPNPDYNRNRYHEMQENNIPETVVMDSHFMGSKLFSVNFTDSEKGKVKFLFDIDRNEIEHGIFNPFIVQAPENGTPIETVKDAYLALIPEEVKIAMESGKDVKRQGEWFFIPTDKSPEEPDRVYTEAEKRDFAFALGVQKLNANGWGDNSYSEAKELLGNEEFNRLRNLVIPTKKPIGFVLKAGKNRPNNAEFGLQKDGVSYVKGEISHSGREHKTITLDGWHIAIPNTAIGSFTITGDVD